MAVRLWPRAGPEPWQDVSLAGRSGFANLPRAGVVNTLDCRLRAKRDRAGQRPQIAQTCPVLRADWFGGISGPCRRFGGPTVRPQSGLSHGPAHPGRRFPAAGRDLPFQPAAGRTLYHRAFLGLREDRHPRPRLTPGACGLRGGWVLVPPRASRRLLAAPCERGHRHRDDAAREDAPDGLVSRRSGRLARTGTIWHPQRERTPGLPPCPDSRFHLSLADLCKTPL